MATADVFIQNLAPGAAARLTFGSDELRRKHPRLITCDISGYGESGPLHELKAYDLLVQAESGLVAVSGAPGPWGRIGVSICDITAGMNALIGIQQALIQRSRTGCGSAVKVSLFDSAAELMSVPMLQAQYGSGAPERVGLKHPSITPYGAFTSRDGREFVLSIQNEREWVNFCDRVLQQPALATNPSFVSNTERTRNRIALEALIQGVFSNLGYTQVVERLAAAQTAYGAINSVHDLIEHPQLRTRPMPVNGQMVELPAIPYITEWDDESYRPIPGVDEHGDAAPRLNDVLFTPEAAVGHHATLIREVVRMLCAGVVHGDLSEFNILLAADGPVIIDLPQAVDAAGNNHASRMLLRDVQNLRDFFGRFAPDLLTSEYGHEIWDLYARGLLTPETKLAGLFEAPSGPVDVGSVLDVIEDAAAEEAARLMRIQSA
jgi:crotonobetainyl-CoA:carnitine CoA-transferase CaiB-like acyl-CoA transferase